MSTLGERIRHVRDSLLGLNQADFARRLGFTRTATISDYEKDKRSPDIATLRKIAGAGGVKVEWLLTGDGPVGVHESSEIIEARETPEAAYSDDLVEVKVYDMCAASGPEDFPGGGPIGNLRIPAGDFKRGRVAVRVRGEGMSPTVLDGAIVGVDTSDRDLISGKLYAVWLDYEGVTVKRVFVSPGAIALKPDNPAFPETTIPVTTKTDRDFIIGRVVWLYQRY